MLNDRREEEEEEKELELVFFVAAPTPCEGVETLLIKRDPPLSDHTFAATPSEGGLPA